MGGGAFLQASAPGEPSLSTPRLSHDDYSRLRTSSLQKLQDCFPTATIACPVEAPEKADHGDIDLVVATDEPFDFMSLAKHLGAKALIRQSAYTVTLAVPITGLPAGSPVMVYEHFNGTNNQQAKPLPTTSNSHYAQVDIEIVPTHLMDWHLFYASYGGMAGLLGQIVTHLGFTVNNTGLHLRMRELDESKQVVYQAVADKDGTMLLSHDVRNITLFFGMDFDRLTAGFDTLSDLYEWVGACPLLFVHAYQVKSNTTSARHRAQRPVFDKFFNEWLPMHMASLHDKNDTERPFLNAEQADADVEVRRVQLAAKREVLLQTAVDFFNKRAEYETKHSAVVRQVDNATAGHLLKPVIVRASLKNDKGLNEILRAFRRYVHVTEGDNSMMQVLQVPHEDSESELYRLLGPAKDVLKDEEAVDRWVRQHWEELRGLHRHKR